MAGYSAPGLLDGDYGYNSFWDNMSVGDMHELTLAPQHGDTGLVSALRMREQQNKELERQVKKYGEEEMAPALHAHDGMESSMMPGSETGIDGSGYRRQACHIASIYHSPSLLILVRQSSLTDSPPTALGQATLILTLTSTRAHATCCAS